MTDRMSALETESSSRWDGRFSITTTLMLVIGLLILVSVGSVLGVGIWLAQKNTFALLSENAHQGISAASASVRQYLEPAEFQAQFLAERIAIGDIDANDHQALSLLLSGALSGAEQIDTVMFIDTQLQAHVAEYDHQRGEVQTAVLDYSNDPLIQERIDTLVPGVNWGSAIWRESTQKTYLDLAYPVYINGEYNGVVISVVPVESISGFVSDIDLHTSGVMFVLLGNHRVLGHPFMVQGYEGMNSETPLPLLEEFSDTLLATFGTNEGRRELRLNLPDGTKGHSVVSNGEKYVFVYQQIPGFGAEPLTVGAYFRKSEFGEEVERVVMVMVAGIVALIISLFAAVYLGRKIAQPIVRFSNAASGVRNLDLSQVKALPGSPFRELNDQSASFNAMLHALRWFELYIPKRVVEHLIQRGDVRKTISDSRNMTVMFTDMVDFSRISEGMSAREVAKLVNHHFSLIGECINDEEGTVDKYIGDSVMAFWGAPEKQKHRADRACRAAMAIGASIREDNARRKTEGKLPIGIRIGIHTGDVTVGNIGAPGRINYTIIGDAVNIGVRLEQLGKEVNPPGTEVSILISGATARDLGDEFRPEYIGLFKLKGRESKVEVFSLS
jgi:adenylate cyclase